MRLAGQGRILVGLLSVHALLLGYGAAIHAPGWDEVGHLPAGISHWQLGNTDLYRVNPPLVRMLATLPLMGIEWDLPWAWSSAPLARPEFGLGRELWTRHGAAAYWYLTYARWAVIPLSLLAGLVIFRWSRDLYGGAAGLLAVSLWCFSPMVLTNAQLITPDVGSAALGALAGYAFWKWLHDRSADIAWMAGILLGLAQLTKFTWIILYLLWPTLWALHFLRDRRSYREAWRWPEGGQLVCILALSLLVINIGFAFEGTMTRLGDYRFVSATLTGTSSQDRPRGERTGNRFSDSWPGRLPVPLPSNYVLGIDRQKYDFDSSNYMSYLRGEWRDRGWWYYYLYGLAIKEPVGFIVLALMAGRMTARRRDFWRDEGVLLAPAALVLVLVSSQTGFNHHLRYVLPAFPFAFIWMGKLWGRADDSESPVRDRWRRRAAAVMLACGIAPSLYVYPHSHAYFNSLVGGPMRGHEHLLDSNLDWGQDLLLLADWAERHPQMKLDGVAYSLSHLLPRADVGLPDEHPPKGYQPGDYSQRAGGVADRDAFGPRPGLWAVFVRPLHDQHPNFHYFQFFEPIEVLGYTVYIYQLDEEDVRRYWEAQEDAG